MTDYGLSIDNSDLKKRYAAHSSNEEITDLTGEIALLRTCLENVLMQMKSNVIDGTQVILINKLVQNITDTMEKMTKIQTRMDLFVSAKTIPLIFAQISNIIEKYVKNPIDLEQIAIDIEQIDSNEEGITDG